MAQAYVKLRGAVWAENGYCLVAPGEINRDACVYITATNRDGKTVHIEKMAGCEGDDDPVLVVVLQPYRDEAMGRAAVLVMCDNLEAAMKSDKSAQKRLGLAWQLLALGAATGFESAPPARQVELLGAFYGNGRVSDEWNRHGHIAGLAAFDPTAMVAEALGQ